MVTSIISEMKNKARAISYRLLLMSSVLFLYSSLLSAQNDTTIYNTDSLMVDLTDIPDSGRVSIISDSIKQVNHWEMIRHSEKFFNQWKDQFPSYIVQFIYGLPIEKDYDVVRKEQREDWKFYLSFILLALLALIRFSYAKEFDELFNVFKNLGPSQQMYRELGTGVSFGTVLLNLFSATVLSFYVFLLFNYFGNIQIEQGWVMVFSSLVVVFFLLVRYVSLKLASVLLPFRKEITLYNFYEIQINRSMGVALFPMLLLIAFSKNPFNEYALYFSIVVASIFFFLRYLKGFNIGSNYFGRDLLHFLLYICALEIAPVLIIIRVLLNLGPLRFSF